MDRICPPASHLACFEEIRTSATVDSPGICKSEGLSGMECTSMAFPIERWKVVDIYILDFVIITRERCYSFADEGIIYLLGIQKSLLNG